MSYEYTLSKPYWTVHTGTDVILFGGPTQSRRISTPHTSFGEFDTEQELADYLGELTGDPNYYWDHKPQEEQE